MKTNLLSLVSQDGILTIQNSKLRKKELPEETLCSENNVLDLVLDNGGKAIAWLNKSQSHMRKRSVERYANHQHGLVSSSFNYDEDISIIKEVSTSIVCPEILQEYKKLSHLKKRLNDSVSERIVSDRNSNLSISDRMSDRMQPGTVTNSISNQTPIPINPQLLPILYEPIACYCICELPSRTGTYYTPYVVAKFLFKHEMEKITVAGKRMFKNTLIRVLIQMKVVPVSKNSLYRLTDLYSSKCLSPDDVWSVVTCAGKKPKLSYIGFNDLVIVIREKSEGGLSIPFSKVKKMVSERIIYETQIKSGNHIVPSVHQDTLCDYASCIMSQNIFNVNVCKIPYKIETRSTAEWSFCITISFLCNCDCYSFSSQH